MLVQSSIPQKVQTNGHLKMGISLLTPRTTLFGHLYGFRFVPLYGDLIKPVILTYHST